ncbi:MAG: site-specific integrase [Candidatus Thiodiazotropha sp. (ex. Lucinoma kazani)]
MPRKKKRDQDGIHQRPDSPYWWATIPNGRGGSTRRSTRISIADDPQGLKAKAVRAGWIADGPPEPPVIGESFDDLMLAYLGQVTPTKRDPERDHVSAKALYPVFSGKALADIGAAEVRGYIAMRTQAERAPGTINKEIGLMSAALNWAKRELEWDVGNPWCQRKLKEPAGRNRWLTQEEADLLLKSSREARRAPHLVDFIRLGLHSGMRTMEMLGLEWSRVDLSSRLLYLGAGDQKNGTVGSIPLNKVAREAVLSRARFRAEHCPGSPWVFCNKKGRQIASVKTGFKLAVERAGLENVHPHDLRRTFGSWLVQAGVDIHRVSELMRHSDIRTTSKVYAHLSPRNLADAVEVLDRTLAG